MILIAGWTDWAEEVTFTKTKVTWPQGSQCGWPHSASIQREKLYFEETSYHKSNEQSSIRKEVITNCCSQICVEKTLTKSKGVLFQLLYPLIHPSQQLVNCTSRVSQRSLRGRLSSFLREAFLCDGRLRLLSIAL